MAHLRVLPAAFVLASLAFVSHSAAAANLPMLLNLSAAISTSMTAASQDRARIRPIVLIKKGGSSSGTLSSNGSISSSTPTATDTPSSDGAAGHIRQSRGADDAANPI